MTKQETKEFNNALYKMFLVAIEENPQATNGEVRERLSWLDLKWGNEKMLLTPKTLTDNVINLMRCQGRFL